MESVFNLPSFLIGLFLGMIILIIVWWVCFITNTFVFQYCPTETPLCGGVQYFNNPGDALGNDRGLTAGNILYIENGVMFYQRVPATNNCSPSIGQTIQIDKPQYCNFKDTNGKITEWKQNIYGTGIYKQVGVQSSIPVIAKLNCVPDCVGSDPTCKFVSGEPVLQWNPITPT